MAARMRMVAVTTDRMGATVRMAASGAAQPSVIGLTMSATSSSADSARNSPATT